MEACRIILNSEEFRGIAQHSTEFNRILQDSVEFCVILGANLMKIHTIELYELAQIQGF